VPDDTTTERLDTLEAIIAEQQQTIDELSEMVTKQWDAHEKLKHQLAKMTDQLQDIEENQPAPVSEKAPHY